MLIVYLFNVLIIFELLLSRTIRVFNKNMMGIATMHPTSVKIASGSSVHGEGYVVIPFQDREHPCTKPESAATGTLLLLHSSCPLVLQPVQISYLSRIETFRHEILTRFQFICIVGCNLAEFSIGAQFDQDKYLFVRPSYAFLCYLLHHVKTVTKC